MTQHDDETIETLRKHGERQQAVYDSDREAGFQAYLGLEESYDKWVVTLASGAFGVSLAFLKDFAQARSVHPRIILYGWICLLVSIASVLCNLRLCVRLQKQHLDLLDKGYERHTDPRVDVTAQVRKDQEDLRWLKVKPMKVLGTLNNLSLAAFLAGLALLAAFAYCNLH